MFTLWLRHISNERVQHRAEYCVMDQCGILRNVKAIYEGSVFADAMGCLQAEWTECVTRGEIRWNFAASYVIIWRIINASCSSNMTVILCRPRHPRCIIRHNNHYGK